MASDQAGQYGFERKGNVGTSATGGSEGTKSGPGALEQDRDVGPSHHKRSWKDNEAPISASRRTFTSTHCKPSDGLQVRSLIARQHSPPFTASPLTTGTVKLD